MRAAAIAAGGRRSRILWALGDGWGPVLSTPQWNAADSPYGMVAQWYNEPADFGFLSAYENPATSDTLSRIYGGTHSDSGLPKAAQMIVWIDPAVSGNAAYAVSSQFYNTDIARLANILIGNGPNHGPAYLVLFSEFETYSADTPGTGYWLQLRTSFLNAVSTIRAITLPAGASIKVGLGFGGYIWAAATPTRDMSFWQPCIDASDFTCAQAMHGGTNVNSLLIPQIDYFTADLAQFGKPIMISHLKIFGSEAEQDTGMTTFYNNALVSGKLETWKRRGLFAVNFMSDYFILDDNNTNVATTAAVKVVMGRHANRAPRGV